MFHREFEVAFALYVLVNVYTVTRTTENYFICSRKTVFIISVEYERKQCFNWHVAQFPANGLAPVAIG